MALYFDSNDYLFDVDLNEGRSTSTHGNNTI